MSETAKRSGRINWTNLMTVGSACVLVGAMMLVLGFSTGWALAGILGLEVGPTMGPFVPVSTANGVTLDFYSVPGHHEQLAHYAFLVSEEEFDAAFARIEALGVTYYPGPSMDRPGEINHHDGGRGLYFFDPTGNTMELITVPYGGWPT